MVQVERGRWAGGGGEGGMGMGIGGMVGPPPSSQGSSPLIALSQLGLQAAQGPVSAFTRMLEGMQTILQKEERQHESSLTTV